MSRASNARTLFIVLLVSLVVSVFDVNLYAQVAGGTISGTVTDSSGRLINNVQITITNVATGVTRDVTTNEDGFYSAPNLLPGNYEAKFTAPGFKGELRTGIEIAVGASVGLDQQLRVGAVGETVEVQSEVPAVQLSTSDMSAVVNATTVRELPLNGRSWTDLAQLQPGVSAIHTQPDFSAGTDRGNRGFGQQLTISGARPQQNNYRLDGVSLNDYANGAPGSVLGGNLGVDAIVEFSVLTTNYSAEYGKTSGGVINAITRSGTNKFHGDVYEFLRNSALDARNFFDGATVPPFRRNQFGGTVGGPIMKNKLFYFVNYEGLRQFLSQSFTSQTLSPNARNGILTTGVVAIDPRVKPYLALYPVPNGAINGDTGFFNFGAGTRGTEDYVTGRVDYVLTAKDTLSSSYTWDNGGSSTPDAFDEKQT